MPALDLCRICLTEATQLEEMQPLFDKTNANCQKMVNQILVCGGISIKPHSELPNMMCQQCVKALETSVKFRELCRKSEKELMKLVIKKEVREDEEHTSSEYSLHSEAADANVEIILDIHNTEFINAEEVDVKDITGEENFSEIEECDDVLAEFLSGSESDAMEKKEKLKAHKSNKTKSKSSDVNHVIMIKRKRGRPRRDDTEKHTKDPNAPKKERKRKKSREAIMHNIQKVVRKNDERNHPSSIMCEICGNIYAKQSMLNAHMRRHMAEKPFSCEICEKRFACAAEVRRHIRIHTGEKPYVCKHCGRSFGDRSSHIKHERIHTNTRPFVCHTCGKAFTYSNVLKNHMLIHTGEKPFSCVPCNKTFSREHQLKQHEATICHRNAVAFVNGGLEVHIKVDRDAINETLHETEVETEIQ